MTRFVEVPVALCQPVCYLEMSEPSVEDHHYKTPRLVYLPQHVALEMQNLVAIAGVMIVEG